MARLRIVSLIVCAILVSCATPLTDEEREWRQGIDFENYRLCALAYKQAGKYMIHNGHTHDRGRRLRHDDIKQDLWTNHCRMVLRDYWIEY